MYQFSFDIHCLLLQILALDGDREGKLVHSACLPDASPSKLGQGRQPGKMKRLDTFKGPEKNLPSPYKAARPSGGRRGSIARGKAKKSAAGTSLASLEEEAGGDQEATSPAVTPRVDGGVGQTGDGKAASAQRKRRASVVRGSGRRRSSDATREDVQKLGGGVIDIEAKERAYKAAQEQAREAMERER